MQRPRTTGYSKNCQSVLLSGTASGEVSTSRPTTTTTDDRTDAHQERQPHVLTIVEQFLRVVLGETGNSRKLPPLCMSKLLRRSSSQSPRGFSESNPYIKNISTSVSILSKKKFLRKTYFITKVSQFSLIVKGNFPLFLSGILMRLMFLLIYY